MNPNRDSAAFMAASISETPGRRDSMLAQVGAAVQRNHGPAACAWRTAPLRGSATSGVGAAGPPGPQAAPAPHGASLPIGAELLFASRYADPPQATQLGATVLGRRWRSPRDPPQGAQVRSPRRRLERASGRLA